MPNTRLSTPEKIVLACLSDKNRPLAVSTITAQCDLGENYPVVQLLKVMARKGYIIYDKETGKYSFNPIYEGML